MLERVERLGKALGQVLPAALELYRDLHRHPELSMREHRTQTQIRAALSATTATVRSCAGTGLVATLRNGDGPVVAMRADTDALPIRETTGLPYASVVEAESAGGRVPVMHACGHDVHTAAMVAATAHLDQNRDSWTGTLVALFQPGEETGVGAATMIGDGCFDDTGVPDVILAQHVTSRPAGQFLCRPGYFLSHAQAWMVTVDGHGGHASRPHLAQDPIVAAAAMITRLQTIVSREVDPFRMAVVSIGSIHGGDSANVIPSQVTFTVMSRSYETQIGEHIAAAVHRIIDGEAATAGVRARIEALTEIPPCWNDPAETAVAVAALTPLFGADAVLNPADPLPASDDFSQYAKLLGIPSAIWNFGCLDPAVVASGGPIPRNHTGGFAPHPTAAVTVGAVAAVAVLTRRFQALGSNGESPEDVSVGISAKTKHGGNL
jgi:hippurate hydrolase